MREWCDNFFKYDLTATPGFDILPSYMGIMMDDPNVGLNIYIRIYK